MGQGDVIHLFAGWNQRRRIAILGVVALLIAGRVLALL